MSSLTTSRHKDAPREAWFEQTNRNTPKHTKRCGHSSERCGFGTGAMTAAAIVLRADNEFCGDGATGGPMGWKGNPRAGGGFGVVR